MDTEEYSVILQQEASCSAAALGAERLIVTYWRTLKAKRHATALILSVCLPDYCIKTDR